MRACTTLFFFLLIGGCQASVGDDDGGDNQIHALPPLVATPEGYPSEPDDAAVGLPEGTTISVEQLYGKGWGADGDMTLPPEILGGMAAHISVTVHTDNPTAFPGAPEEELLGLNLYVNGCPLPLESMTPIEAPTRWAFYVEGQDDIPIQVLPGHFMVWELRAWRCPPVEEEEDAGPDGGDADTDSDTSSDTSTDTGSGETCPQGAAPIEVKVLYRGIDELPPGLPNFLTPAPGEVLVAGDSLTVTWEPLGIEAFTGSPIDLQMQGWIQGGAGGFGIRPDPATAIPVDADRGELTFNVGSFADWDWIDENLVVPLTNFDLRYVGAVHVND